MDFRNVIKIFPSLNKVGKIEMLKKLSYHQICYLCYVYCGRNVSLRSSVEFLMILGK